MKKDLRQKAILFRKKGMSYSQIKNKISVSKSTLSLWLRDYPLSKKDLVRLRDKSEIRIEKFRNTMLNKKNIRREAVYLDIKKYMGVFSERDYFLAGVFIYLGEGLKSEEYTVNVSNTNPVVLKIFIKWLQLLGADREKIKIKIHIYSDMNVKDELKYWSDILDINIANFQKTYIKESKMKNSNYKTIFRHGTCNVLYYDRDIADKVKMCLKYIENLHL